MATTDIDLGVLARGPQGPKGEQGNPGPAPTLKIGTVTKLGPNQMPTANLSGGNGSYTLNLGIPQGETNATATNALNVANSALSKANSNATALNNKANKSDLTWANISGKPSISNADDTTTVSSGDLNNYTTTGKYYMPHSLSNYANHPTTGTDMGNWFVMKVDVYKPAPMIVQTIYQVNSGDVWVRTKFGSNAWKSWRQINFWS